MISLKDYVESVNNVKLLTVNNKFKKGTHQQTEKPQENNELPKHCNEEHHVECRNEEHNEESYP